MRHRQIKRLLSAYLDDELDDQQRQQIQLHLQNCNECNGILADMRQNHIAISSLQQPRPEGIWDAIQQHIPEEQPVSSWRRISTLWKQWMHRPVPVGAGILVTTCLVLGLLYLYPTGDIAEEPLDLYVALHTGSATSDFLAQEASSSSSLMLESALPEDTQLFLNAYLVGQFQ